jgi:hypothetical protein
MTYLSHYPDGCTDRHIDEAAGVDCFEDCAADTADGWNGDLCDCEERAEELRLEGEAVRMASSLGIDY